jgi:hypothetical protein
MTTQRPLMRFRAGTISCAVWGNEITTNGRPVQLLKVTVERRYMDAAGKWQSSRSFGRNEIPLVIYCLEKAFEFILSHERSGEDDGMAVEAESGRYSRM